MRMFWLAICVLALVVAIVAWRNNVSGGSQVPPPTPVAMQTNGSVGSDAGVPVNSDINRASLDAGNNTAQPSSAALRQPPAQPTAAPSPTPDQQALADDLMTSADRGSGDEDIGDALDDGSVPAPGNHDEGSGGGAGSTPASPAKIDGKYIVAGEGTADAPYEITWDLLILASQTYQPRQGKTDIPPQVAAVNGKRIKIAGYYAVPIASTDPKEVLFMLNMWDGCCIGVPPSPYDAIEVRLKEPLGTGKQYVSYGTLTGTLSVDPYVQNGWLLGMYVMQDGELEAGM